MRLITDILRDYRRGCIVDVASERLADVVRAVDETGKPGSLTITIKVKPETGGGSQKVIAGKVSAKIPERDLPEAMFFSDASGDLHRSDPTQSEMFAEAGRGPAPAPSPTMAKAG